MQEVPFHRGIKTITSLMIILKVRSVAVCLDISLVEGKAQYQQEDGGEKGYW